MRYGKQIIGTLEKCYALASVRVNGRECLLAAAEKHSPCYLFSKDGQQLETVWEGPGGVMTMVALPGREGAFLATHEFYSPNDGKNARLVLAERKEEGWTVTDLCSLPCVHRFGILSRGGVNYLIACTLKSDHEYRDDWRFPGKIWVGELPDKPGKEPLKLEVLRGGLLRNHGFTLYPKGDHNAAVISCEQGVFLIDPPERPGGCWEERLLMDGPASDAVLTDLDGDGQPELLVIRPFHGDSLTVWHEADGGYEPVYEHPEKLPFLHAIDFGELYGRPVVLVGNREERKELLCVYYDREKRDYVCELVDSGHGPANCMIFERHGHPAILAANRESDEIAIYDVYGL